MLNAYVSIGIIKWHLYPSQISTADKNDQNTQCNNDNETM